MMTTESTEWLTENTLLDYYPERNGQHRDNREPYEAGDADAYYGRPYQPSFAYQHRQYTAEEMTPWQIEEYTRGYFENESGKKEW